jgi:hypothetical protein
MSKILKAPNFLGKIFIANCAFTMEETSMKMLSTILSLMIFSTLQLCAKEVVITPTNSDSFIIDVEPSAPFLEVVEQIQGHLAEMDNGMVEEGEEISFSYALGFPGIFAKKAKTATTRNYNSNVTASEKENIRFIIRSLAKYNWAQLAKEESSLKRAGDKINHVHPLRFLQTVFTDEELKVGIYVIRNKSLVWGEYYDGLKKSLNEESDSNNFLQFLPDFASKVGVNLQAILPFAQTRQWNALIEVLIQSIPRQGNPDRYDM